MLILLNSNHLNAWIQIIEHLLRVIKWVITGENGFFMLYFLSTSYSIQHNEKTITNTTTTRDQTDDMD